MYGMQMYIKDTNLKYAVKKAGMNHRLNITLLYSYEGQRRALKRRQQPLAAPPCRCALLQPLALRS